MNLRTTLLISALAAATALAPVAQASFHIPDENRYVPETLDAGEFYAVRIDAPEEGRVVLSTTYDVTTDQPVLPSLLVVDHRASEGASMWGTFVYARDNAPEQGGSAWLSSPAGSEAIHTHENQAAGQGVSISTSAEEGVTDLVIATTPGEDEAVANLHIPPEAEIVATQVGDAIFERGLDHSLAGYDVQLYGPLSTYARSWGYTGATVDVGVEDRLYGYMGGPWGSDAAWENPDGGDEGEWVRGGESGDWTAAFPEEEYQGPFCDELTDCSPQPFRGDPPYALGADVDLAS
jgi:hypothetical protein